jgi:hypothetical protein
MKSCLPLVVASASMFASCFRLVRGPVHESSGTSARRLGVTDNSGDFAHNVAQASNQACADVSGVSGR